VTGNPSRFGILETDESNKITNFEEKPDNPKSDLGSMGIYVFNTKALKSLLNENKEELVDFGHDIIPLALSNKLNVCAYEFDGYFKDVGTIESLYEANMDLIDNPHFLKIRDYNNFPLLTKSLNLPPHHVVSSDQIIDSFISDGCLIYGEIIHSILSSGILVDKGTVIKNSLIHPNVKVGSNCIIENAIITQDSIVLSGTSLVFDKVTVVDNEYLWKFGDNHE
jgi:glucose-1-phosphate adenylyltransferase